MWMFAFLFASPLVHLLFRTFYGQAPSPENHDILQKRQVIQETCQSLNRQPVPSQSFLLRNSSDRFEKGTRATLIRNATIFTGEYSDKGPHILLGDILLDGGLVKDLGNINHSLLSPHTTIIDAEGAFVTPGLIDLQSHLGILSLPFLDGSRDANSRQGPILPSLRALDALHTYDPAFELAVAGGVTTAQIIPGNENLIGGQPAIIKLRQTSTGSPTSMLVEPSGDLWGRLYHGCGEDVSRTYGLTRMDSAWALRAAYAKAKEIMTLQDDYCRKADAGIWREIENRSFPNDLQLAMLVKVLRGNAKVSVHCNEVVDLDAFARLSYEFEFPISAFHQASEAWLVPQMLNETWGPPPTVFLSHNYRLTRETFRGSEFAAKVLSESNFSVAVESGHPALSSQHLIFEAQQAYYYGLDERFALSAVTSTPAISAGISHRVGKLHVGYDADLVLWDSHPLNVGAVPKIVWIDGILQVPTKVTNYSVTLQPDRQSLKRMPNWEQERAESLKWNGLSPLQGRHETGKVVFRNVQEVTVRTSDGGLEVVFRAKKSDTLGIVVVDSGKIICADVYCYEEERKGLTPVSIDIMGGSISPGFLSYGTPLGLSEMAAEPSTGNGDGMYNAFIIDVPKVIHDVGGLLRAGDSLIFQTRNALLAYRSGVTCAVSVWTKPLSLLVEGPVISGLSVAFRTGSMHAMKLGAIMQDVVALHVTIAKPRYSSGVSVGEQIAGLKRLLLGWEGNEAETGIWFKKASEGIVPLLIEVHNSDIMARLLMIKAQVEDQLGSRMRMVFSGALESHLIATEISRANVGVILDPRPMPTTWDGRRILPGPPLSNETALGVLLRNGVKVGIKSKEPQMARNVRFDLTMIAHQESMKIIDVYALATKNMEELLGLRVVNDDLVAYHRGNAFDLSSKPVAVISPQLNLVDVFS